MSYNVENLFDCRHDDGKNDYEFLPGGAKHWDEGKYYRKRDAIARVIAAVGEGRLPALVALQEVENDTTLTDLVRHSALREANYRYVMTSSPDARGIDVALLYQPGAFRLIGVRSICIPRLSGRRKFRPTRDVLHATGVVADGDTLDVFVCHFPSKLGGAKKSEPFRRHVFEQVKAAADTVARARRHPRILVMGDFNAPCKDFEAEGLQHVVAHSRENGSYKYRGRWQLIDHIVASPELLRPDASMHLNDENGHIFAPAFLMTEDQKYRGVQPNRTYQGPRYQGGFSDHLPVWAEFVITL
jgi:predicted extracellular nuclease